MNKKEIIFLFSVPILVAVFFLIVTPSQSEYEKKKAAEIAGSYPTGWEKVRDNLSKTIHVNTIVEEKMDKLSWKQEMLDKRFNIKTDFQYYSPEAVGMKLPLLLVSGQTPDYFFASASLVRKFAENNLIMELPYDMLKKYTPTRVDLVNKYAPNTWLAIMYDGKNYGLPSVWIDGMIPRTSLWRKDWLDKVGIEKVPDTVDEYHEAFKRFTNNDPDGNGEKDTYGFSADLVSNYSFCTEIFGAYGVMPFNWMEKDDKVVWGGIQPETKQVLSLLHQWYKEGLIHPDFITDRWWDEVAKKFYNGKTGYHNYMCSKEALNADNPSSIKGMMNVLQPGNELIPGHPPMGPEGKRGHRVWGAANGRIIVFGKHMAKHPDKVIRILKMLDTIDKDEELYVQVNVGLKGRHWDWKDPKVGMGSGIKMLSPFDQERERKKEGFVDPTVFGGSTYPEIYEKYLPKSMLEFRNTHRSKKWGRADLFNWNDTPPRSDEFLKDLIQLQQVYFGDIIRGVRPVSSFDEFVQKWKAQGGEILTEEANKLFDKRKEIFRKLNAGENK